MACKSVLFISDLLPRLVRQLLAPLAHAIAHNHGPKHDRRNCFHESYLLRKLQDDTEVRDAHEAWMLEE